MISTIRPDTPQAGLPLARSPHRADKPLNRPQGGDNVRFSALQGNEDFTLTVDFPESLRRQTDELKAAWRSDEGGILSVGMQALELLAHERERNASASFAMVKQTKPNGFFSTAEYAVASFSERAGQSSAGATQPLQFKLNVDQLAARRQLARQFGRSLEQLYLDAFHLAYSIRHFQKAFPDRALCIASTYSDGTVDDIVPISVKP